MEDCCVETLGALPSSLDPVYVPPSGGVWVGGRAPVDGYRPYRELYT